MEADVKTYTVKQVAKMAGVSVRTLHHYDQIGLLSPVRRTTAGYRQYSDADLLRLQQILFFRELDFSLKDIGRILDHPDFDQVDALCKHRRMLAQRVARLNRLIQTVDRTIYSLSEDNMPLTDDELYEGFSKEQVERYEREVKEMYDPKKVEETNQRIRKLSKEQWQQVKDEGAAVNQALAALMDCEISDPQVQEVIDRHHAWIENFYPAPVKVYRGLGELYTGHDEFRAHYEEVAPGLAEFLKAAMDYYCDHTLAV
jgi:DNA-binding transcriptional MerR regulator